MKWIYVAAGIAFYLKMVILPGIVWEAAELSVVERVLQDTGVPNAVSGIIFRNRLYDTIFEVVVFTLAIMGVRFLLADEQPSTVIYQFTDHPSIVLARLGATIAALISIELAIRGHLSPGGGFAAGVAGGTAIGLVAITSSSTLMEARYQRWRAAAIEKVSVLIFLAVAGLSLLGVALPLGTLGTLVSGGWIPVLNLLVAVKVALGSWAAILIFIRYRGLL
ncbi:Na(+)/H(+) antiporter subunit B [Leptolyngbya sp. PCC 6406]|uniref:Na(+)/H(+) antiporter subunit B n=1 Tax=Leptolyngbya sp. PCC 6406 TaxID=1173264 RepID=UPI0004888EDE|nr:Na(+)/H(+) antiporter subunit B [Leptolyngbya sp. PCC 6406]